ncbi:MAG: glycosyltransferase family 39 protein [Ardenticatenales bacterium]
MPQLRGRIGRLWTADRDRRWRGVVRAHGWDIAAAVAAVWLGAFYCRHLTAWLINDDEGSYLYAAWRIALGERPYRDFLTPQLPVFLLPGGWLMRHFGPSYLAARLLAVGLTLTAAGVTWATARRLFGSAVAAIALVLCLLQPDVYAVGRIFRPEPFMLAAQALAVAAFARGAIPRPGREGPPSRAWLAVSGALFGVATLAKLFGPWPLGGLLLWLIVDGRRRHRPAGAVARDVLAALLATIAVTAAGLVAIGLYSGGIDRMLAATIGHHLRQGASKPMVQVVAEGFGLWSLYVRDAGRALALALALAVAWDAWRRPGREAGLFAWQLVSALAFFALARDRYPRHLVYLAPALAVLASLALVRLHAAARRAAETGLLTALAACLAVGLAANWYLYDRDYITARAEDGTTRLADVIDALTGPDDVVLSDYSELNFYAGRPTTYAAASLSTGAVSSGQITWGRIADDIARSGRPPALVVLETGSPYSHLSYLRGADRAAFQAWLADGWRDVGGVERGDVQHYRLYLPREHAVPIAARFEDGPSLVQAAPDHTTVAAGEAFHLTSIWRADGAIADPLSLTVRLVDAAGNEPIAPIDALLTASGTRPTDRWAADEFTAQSIEVRLPPGVPPGDYRLLLGLYRRADGRPTALGVSDAAGAPIGAAVTVGSAIHVTGSTSSSDRGAARMFARTTGRTADVAAPPTRSATSDAIALVGAGAVPTSPVAAGTVWPLTLAFRLHRAGPPPPISLTLRDRANGAIAADVALPLAAEPAPPPSAWPAGLFVVRTVRIPVYANAAGGRYTVAAAWGEGSAAAEVDLGTVEVTPSDVSGAVFELDPPLPIEIGAELGDVGTLLGAAAPISATAGAALTVKLAWRARSPSGTPYKVTVQLLGPDGRPVAQHDAEPADGARPTTGWLPGEIILDRHTLALPADLGTGDYTLVAALYHPLTAERLARTAGRADEVAPGLIRLGNVHIR